MFDAAGRAFAVATESLEGPGIQQINFAVPLSYAMALLTPQTTEQPLSDSPLSPRAPEHSDFEASIAELDSWSRPKPTSNPTPSLSGQYAFVSRSADRSTGAFNGKSLGELIVGENVGLVAVAGGKGVTTRVAKIGPLTLSAAGIVALYFVDLNMVGYQTSEGFWVSHDSAAKSELLELQTKKSSRGLDAANGLYAASCSTQTLGSISVGGERFQTKREGPDWIGEVAIIVADGQVHVDLFMKNSAGGSTRMNASGPISEGRFEIRDGGRRLTGTLVAGRMSAQWVDERSADLRFEGTLRAERR